MPNDYKTVHKHRIESGQAKDPQNNSRISVEGIDTPKPPESDYPVMDPWNKDYPYRAGAHEMLKTA